MRQLLASLTIAAAASTLPAQFPLICDQTDAVIRPTEYACVVIRTAPVAPGITIQANISSPNIAVTPASQVTDAAGEAVFKVSCTGVDLLGSSVTFFDTSSTFSSHNLSVVCDVDRLRLQGTAGSEPGPMQFQLIADPPVTPGESAVVFLSPFPGQIPLSIFNFNEPRFLDVGAFNLLIPPGYAGAFQAPYDTYFTPSFNIPDLAVKGLAFYVQAVTLDLASPVRPFERLSQPEPVYLGPTNEFCDRFTIMNTPRSFFPVIETHDQRPMALGGGQGAIFAQIATDECEIYNPLTDTWTVNTARMNDPRSLHTATKLPNGKYLIVGGVDSNNDPQDTAEIYDPTTNTFIPVGNLSTPRVGHTATLLANGNVLIAGGLTEIGAAGLAGIITTINSAADTTEIFTPDALGCRGTFSAGPTMTRGRGGHSALELADGRIMMIGGVGPGFLSIPSIWSQTEFYNGSSFSSGPSMANARAIFPIVQIEEGPDRYLIAGGLNDVLGAGAPTATAEIYTASPGGNGSWSSAGSMTTPRGIQGAYLVNDQVLNIGGITGDLITPFSVGDIEIYDIATGTWSAGPLLTFPRGAFGHYEAPYGQIHLIGGATGAGPTPPVDFSTEWFFR